MVLINAIATMGVNIGMGFAGLVSIGHAGFAAIGAYACTLLMVHGTSPISSRCRSARWRRRSQAW